MSGYNLEASRHEAQKKQMEDLGKRGICAFCQENIEKEQQNPIELASEHWIVKKNDYPYENTALHLLLIPKVHVRTFGELPPTAMADFAKTISLIEKQWKLTSYALGMRSGDMTKNGGSVEHLHAHVVVGDTQNPNHQPVRFKMSS